MLREHLLPFGFIWHEASVRSDSDGFCSRSVDDIFGRWRVPPLYIFHSIQLFLDTSCVLFAYFVLRTRRDRPRHFRHVCLLLLGVEYRRGCRCNPVRIYEQIAKKSRRNATFCVLLFAACCTYTGLSTIPRLLTSEC